MAYAFLLRFQEDCLEEATTPVLGTATMTRVSQEQPDSDPASTSLTALNSGTETITKIANEQRDSDTPHGSIVLPRRIIEMGTKTSTAVRAETSDTDPGQLNNQALDR